MNTNTNTGGLKSCPCCGSRAESWQEVGDDGRHAAFTGCMDDDCRAKTGPWPTRIDSEIAWNQRTDDAPPVSNKATITVQRYRDSNGNPTCCGHTNEDVCPPLVWGRFGFGARCRQLGPRIKRRSDSCYPLIPLPNCPVWKDDGRYDPEHCIVPVQSRLEIKEDAPGGNAMIYQWIKVSDRLPPIGEVVWLYENGSIYTGGRADCEDGWLWGMCCPDAWWLDDDGWTGEIMTDSRYKPTHWMPKPLPPEREGTLAESEIVPEGQALRDLDAEKKEGHP